MELLAWRRGQQGRRAQSAALRRAEPQFQTTAESHSAPAADGLNRLTNASATGAVAYNQTFAYDI
jgi:hypothetical protein